VLHPRRSRLSGLLCSNPREPERRRHVGTAGYQRVFQARSAALSRIRSTEKKASVIV
jgi:hypothetical protein